MQPIYDLPEPDQQAKIRSEKLVAALRQKIEKASGFISFATFMQNALYHPKWGFYNNENCLGATGHFITAPLLSPLFGKCVANQIAEIMRKTSVNALLEFGAGTSQLACDLLWSLAEEKSLPAVYYIVEISALLREKQRIFLQEHAAPFLSRIKWIDKVPENFAGIIVANEVLDALPVTRFKIINNAIYEMGVNFLQTFQWEYRLAENFEKYIAAFNLPNDYQSEINFHCEQFIAELTNKLQRGIILFFDYGYGARDYYHRERTQGTLSCFYQHRYHADPFYYPGLQDLTAHVNFTQVANEAAKNHCDTIGFTTQAAFLLANGLTEFAVMMAKNENAATQLVLHQAIKKLTFPMEMGERIKVMALAKNVNVHLSGFQLDRRREL